MSRKSLSSLWMTCEKCQSIISQKDTVVHKTECPPSTEHWSHSYIQKSILHSTLEIYNPKELPKNITEKNTHEMVFMSETALQLCEIAIGDRVLITSKNSAIIKTAWPTSEKSLGSISLTKTAIEIDKIDVGLVRVQKFTKQLPRANEIIIDYTSKSLRPQITPELAVSLKCLNERRAFCVGNRLQIPYYGRYLGFKIVKILGEKSLNLSSIESDLEQMSLEENQHDFYECLYSTKWTVVTNDTARVNAKEKPRCTLEDVGGYEELIADLRDIFDVVLGRSGLAGFKMSKGVLLYGSSGIGKTTIANALISTYNVSAFVMNAIEIYTKYSGEGDVKLKELFSAARDHSPSIILIEDIDMLCPKKLGSSGESERRVMGRLLQEIDELQDSDAATLLLATTSKLEAIDSSLRRARRLDSEFEMSAPTPRMRREILDKLLTKIPNNVLEDERNEMSFHTHGFIAADLSGLCTRAAMHAIKRHKDAITSFGEVRILSEDMHKALTRVKPSAMKEILVEVPNVKWSDIGGQEKLKMKLKQAVEWPLKHPEAFTRLGITPPKGLLMYGPPGCSKTMIAKALATESKLNFINIKGPELFSKWVGESERAVRKVFHKARQVAPSIVFIDEIDALGGERASGGAANAGNNVQERVLTQLLTELDGVTALGNVTLVAATNRPDRLDKALLRPGRLDRIVYVPLPDLEAREEIFKIKFAKMPVSDNVTAAELALLTKGYSGAEIQAICHEAAMNALDQSLNANIVTFHDFEVALKIVSPRTPASLVKMYDDYLINN